MIESDQWSDTVDNQELSAGMHSLFRNNCFLAGCSWKIGEVQFLDLFFCFSFVHQAKLTSQAKGPLTTDHGGNLYSSLVHIVFVRQTDILADPLRHEQVEESWVWLLSGRGGTDLAL